MCLSNTNIFYTFRLLVRAMKKRVVGGEDLWHKLAFGEYIYDSKGDHKSGEIVDFYSFFKISIS